MEIDIKVNYKSYPIPERNNFVIKSSLAKVEPVNTGFLDFDNEAFVEIEVGNEISDDKSVVIPPVSKVKTQTDEKRMLFYSMRQIAWDNITFSANNSKAFYYQALFMKDFEDNYECSVPFLEYYPCYQKMNYEQLRTYFTWRTKVREGQVEDTSLSYAFLYVYELLNNIGVESPKEGLDELISFWKGFREFDSKIDKYLLQWIKDYLIYYPLEFSFKEFAVSNNLQAYYPCVFGLDSEKDFSFDLFAGISSYNIKKSAFFNEENCRMISDCFFFILDRIRRIFLKRKKKFEDYIFYSSAGKSNWIPFGNALFYHILRQEDRQVDISDKESYSLNNNRWDFKHVAITEQGRKLVGYIMKEMECALRKSAGVKAKTVADPGMIDLKLRLKLEKYGVIFPEFIHGAVLEFYADFTRKIIKIDLTNLKQIRKDALQIQEKLIVPEEKGFEVSAGINVISADIIGISAGINVMSADIIGISAGINGVNDSGILSDHICSSVTDVWGELKKSLTLNELESLDIILSGKDIKEFSFKNKIMPEVLADGINQKAIDVLGDAVLEFDDDIIVYEEYVNGLKEMLDDRWKS